MISKRLPRLPVKLSLTLLRLLARLSLTLLTVLLERLPRLLLVLLAVAWLLVSVRSWSLLVFPRLLMRSRPKFLLWTLPRVLHASGLSAMPCAKRLTKRLAEEEEE